ncbi:Ptr3 protein [Saccharomycopsis crataegensis]|uniref:Ptr3 protein n=1 Tax=Saccharomycopsis crataegensis TaxID=43959 RepID=A0AAV5QS35_9ASCO|nr:Ptr3 protein [Saccharomycopsis crataegensis]
MIATQSAFSLTCSHQRGVPGISPICCQIVCTSQTTIIMSNQDTQPTIFDSFLRTIESNLYLPAGFCDSSVNSANTFSSAKDSSISQLTGKLSKLNVAQRQLRFDITADATILNCGCIISEHLALTCLKSSTNKFQCPACGDSKSSILGPVLPLRNLYQQIQKFKKMEIPDFASSVCSEFEKSESMTSSKSRRLSISNVKTNNNPTAPSKKSSSFTDNYSRLSSRTTRKRKVSLLSLFQETALKLKDEEYQHQLKDEDMNTQFDLYESRQSSESMTLANTAPPPDDDASSKHHGNSFSSQTDLMGTTDLDSNSQGISSSPKTTRFSGSLGRTASQISNNTAPDTISGMSLSSVTSKTLNFRKTSSSTGAASSHHQHIPAPISIPKANNNLAASSGVWSATSDLFASASSGNTPSSAYLAGTSPSVKDSDSIRYGNSSYSYSNSSFATPQEEFSKEIRFVNNFPVYRKRFQYSTQSSKVKSLLKRSDFIGTGISPDATKFALIDDKKWLVYNIDADSNSPPTLLCCGKNNGFYGENFENLMKLNPKFYPEEKTKMVLGDEPAREMIEKGNWTFEYCALGNNYLVIAGKRIIKVFDLRRHGKPVYTYNIDLPVRCLDISANDQFIACGLTGKDMVTDTEGSLIMLFELFEEEIRAVNNAELFMGNISGSDRNTGFPSSVFSNATSSLITLHYKDPINVVKFSDDAKLLAVSTALESRFMVIDISKPSKPRLVMKASRKLDTSYESEGITDLSFFGYNNKYIALSSVAFNAPSLILQTRIGNLKEWDSVAHPRMLMKLEEIGSSVHKCCASPRDDACAFLTKKGSVYIVHVNKNFERKRLVSTGDVMSATKKSEAASLRFSKDGYKLYVVDRKGILYIEDFVAGTPQNHDVSKCKSIT